MAECPIILTDSHIIVGNSSNQGADVAMSGDVTIDDTGATTIKTSVALAGSPTTTTQSPGDNSTNIATTAYVNAIPAGATALDGLSDCVTDYATNSMFLGSGAGAVPGSTSYNTSVGVNTCAHLAIGSFYNVAFGGTALQVCTSGGHNTAIGTGAQRSLTTGDDNVTVGWLTGANLIGGSQNILIGSAAGSNLDSGSTNIIIGYNLQAPANNSSNVINIGGIRLDLGISVTITTAALTLTGTQGSMTFTNGILTAQTQAT